MPAMLAMDEAQVTGDVHTYMYLLIDTGPLQPRGCRRYLSRLTLSVNMQQTVPACLPQHNSVARAS